MSFLREMADQPVLGEAPQGSPRPAQPQDAEPAPRPAGTRSEPANDANTDTPSLLVRLFRALSAWNT